MDVKRFKDFKSCLSEMPYYYSRAAFYNRMHLNSIISPCFFQTTRRFLLFNTEEIFLDRLLEIRVPEPSGIHKNSATAFLQRPILSEMVR